MKTKTKINLLIMTLGFLILISTINTKNMTDEQRISGDTLEIKEDVNLKIPKTSRSWWNNFTFIHIDGNWSTAASYEWCSGDGSWGNPYIIENISIDASSSPTESGIFINNSKNEYFILNNCTVYNTQGVWYKPNAGIKLENTNNGTLIKNNCSNNQLIGIHLLNYCENNTIKENILTYCQSGIYLTQNCHNNRITGNIVLSNGNNGIRLGYDCEYNKILENNAYSNGDYGIMVDHNCNHNTISGNTANNHVYYGIYIWFGSNNNTISGNTAKDNGFGIYLENSCDDNNIMRNTANENSHGIILDFRCDNNTISGNAIQDNWMRGVVLTSDNDDNIIINNDISNNITSDQDTGIWVYGNSDNNTVVGNHIKDNQDYGIILGNGENNTIYYNSFKGTTTWYAEDTGTNNHWNNSLIGNYWENYTSPDSNSDGIVDTPYSWITGGSSEDNFPVVETPLHNGEKIHIDNTGVNAWNWSKTAKLKFWCKGSGGKSKPYIIECLEIDGGGSENCILIEESDVYCKVQNCEIYNAGKNGISLHNVNNSQLIGNDCKNNTWAGISLDRSNNNDVKRNYLSDNSEDGIYLGASGSSGIIYSCYNNISGNTITTNEEDGIFISAEGWGTAIVKVNNNTISDNVLTANEEDGIYITSDGFGSAIVEANNNSIYGNTLNLNEGHGISLSAWQEESSVVELKFSNITGNILRENVRSGILLDNCSYTFLTENKLYGNGIGFTELNIPHTLKYTTHTIDTTNTANDKPIYYYTSEIGLEPSDFTDAGQIILMYCQDSVISDVDVSNATIGIYAYLGTNITIYNNNASHGYIGMLLLYFGGGNITENNANHNELAGMYLYSQSNDNDITQNTANNNSYGIALENSHANLISGNTLLNNTICIYQENCIDNVLIGNDCGKPAAGGGGSSGGGGGGSSGDGEETIPGYNILFILASICIISVVMSKKFRKSLKI